ncbi:MAG: DUF3870 domain-containing protein [Eubacteriales bacterium]
MKTILLSAYSQSPHTTIMYEHNKRIGIVLEIEISTHKIVKVEAMFITDLAKDYFNKLINGYNICTEIDEIISRIEKYVLLPSQGSIIAAVKVAHQRYTDNLN